MQIKLPFLTKKNSPKQKQAELSQAPLPEHVAIIMDGNGRWAKKRGMPRFAGHKEGMNNVRNIVTAAHDNKVKILTLYAFSTENWSRPMSEVEYLMKLPSEFLNSFLPELHEKNVRVKIIGHFDQLPVHTQQAIQEAVEKTRYNDGLILNIALNYGSRYEIIQAVQKLFTEMQENNLQADQISESLLSKYLYTGELKDPDLLIRTSGEQRLSNFLLWQSAYTEFWFTEELWPDFDRTLFEKALSDYQQRKRRYGNI